MIRKILLSLAVVLAMAPAMTAQTATLESLVAEANSMCPQKIDQGSTFEAVKLAADAVEIHLTMAIPAAQIPMLEQSMDMLRPAMLGAIVKSPDVRKMCAMAAEKGYGLRMVITSNTDSSASFAIAYTAAELTDALK